MKRWKTLINGTNFQMPSDLPKSHRKGFYRVASGRKSSGIPKVRRMGFYTQVFVAARTPQQAELRAVDILRRCKSLRAAIRNAKDDPPKLFADEIHEIAPLRGVRRPRTGLAFYAERGAKRER